MQTSSDGYAVDSFRWPELRDETFELYMLNSVAVISPNSSITDAEKKNKRTK